MKIIELDETDSTNEYIKRMNFSGEVTVIARRQTAGRGTKGRSFVSGEGGLYLSVLRIFEKFDPRDAFRIMVNACTAVCKTIQSFGVTPEIRWANDVLVGGKKICGTLIENSFSGNGLRSLTGIGLNVTNRLPPELKDIAVNLSEVSPIKVTVREVGQKLIKNLSNEYTIEEYKSYIGFFGKKITLITSSGSRSATALDVAADGRLKVLEENGEVSLISAAEVSLKS